jgi:hypothetical protein
MDHLTYDAARNALTDWLKVHSGWPDSRDPEFHLALKCTPQDFEKAMVCHICALEAEEQPYAGAAAIAHVVMNRTDPSGSPYQTATMILAPCSFRPLNEAILERLLHNVDALFDRRLYDPTLGATDYINIHDLAPGAKSSPSRVTIGDLLFV